MLTCSVGFDGGLVPINFPQREHTGWFWLCPISNSTTPDSRCDSSRNSLISAFAVSESSSAKRVLDRCDDHYDEPQRAARYLCSHLTSVTSVFPFSTIYVASSAAFSVPTFFAECAAPAGINNTSPALSVVGGAASI